VIAVHDHYCHLLPQCEALRTYRSGFPITITHSAACELGAEEQTINHAVLLFPIHRLPLELYSLTVLHDETVDCLLNTCSEIYCGQAVD